MTVTSVSTANGNSPDNNATVTSGNELDVLSGGVANTTTVQNGGTLQVEAGGSETNATIQAGGTENDYGSSSGDLDYGTIYLNSATGSSSTATIAGATVENGGTLNLTLKGALATNTTVLSGGALTINGNAAANGTVLQGGTFELISPKADSTNSSGTSASGTLTFATGSSSRLQLDVAQTGTNGTAFAQTITGFAAGDVIDVVNVTGGTITTAAAAGGNTTVTLTGTNGASESFTFVGAAPAGLTTMADPGTAPTTMPAGGTDIIVGSVTCYCPGTLIRTVRGGVVGETPVEALAIGDRVVTAAGAHRPIRWIGHRAFAGRFVNTHPDMLPIRIKADALADGVPARDLWVSPKHAMYLDGALVPAELLVNGVSVVKLARVEALEYWHVELDSHDVLMAEGAPAESFVDDDSRGMFHNAHTFRTLYPDAAMDAAVYCAPRLEHGFQLDEIRRRIAARAGLTIDAPACGDLQGFVDRIENGVLHGWARSTIDPSLPVCLDVVIDGRIVAQALANRRRADLETLGYGPHAFEVALPAGTDTHAVQIRRAADGARLRQVLHKAA